jgi:cell division protein FtsN
MKATKREIPLISATKKKVVLHAVAKKVDIGTASSYRWTVQVSSCQSLTSAQRLRHQLKRKGFPAYLTEVTLGGKTWHRVRVGFYGTRNKAFQIGKMIKSNFPIKEYLVVQPTDDEKSARSHGKDL